MQMRKLFTEDEIRIQRSARSGKINTAVVFSDKLHLCRLIKLITSVRSRENISLSALDIHKAVVSERIGYSRPHIALEIGYRHSCAVNTATV